MNGSDGSVLRAIRGPITLITVGVLFALNNFTSYRFDQTWPVILIVFGLLSLLRRGTVRQLPAYPPGTGAQTPTGDYPPPGGYRQSSYGQTAPPAGTPASGAPAGPAKGGFGTSAPPRAAGDAGHGPEDTPGSAPPTGGAA